MELFLGIISMVSSTAAAVFGLGGGLILISFLPDFLPGDALVPVHGVTQLASNTSRAAFSFRSIVWRLWPLFFAGSVLGATMFGLLVVNISTAYIPVFIGVYILLKLWSERVGRLLSSFDSLFVLGFLQTGLGILVGSTGHLTMPRLLKEISDRDGIVATSGMFMSLSHGLKLLAYGIIGFKFNQYSVILAYMVTGALIGSFVGTLLRRQISNRWFSQILKILLTVMALIGTTVVPYNLFLHASAVQEKWSADVDVRTALHQSRVDTSLSIGLGGIITLAVLGTSAAAFFGSGIEFSAVNMSRQLEPLLGKSAGYFFAAGLFAAGLSSAVTAPLAAAYAVCGVMGWPRDLRGKRFRQVWFAVLVCGTAFSVAGIKPLAAILFAQAANGFLLPLCAVFLLLVMNRRDVLGAYVNKHWVNGLGGIVVLVTFALGLLKILQVARVF